jgi:hypothetical protein
MRCWATGSNAGFDGRPASGLDRDRVKAVLAPAGRCPDEFGRARQAINRRNGGSDGLPESESILPAGSPPSARLRWCWGPALLNSALCVLYAKWK